MFTPVLSSVHLHQEATPVLAVQKLTKRYGSREVVAHLSFDLYPGQVLGLLGPNGAGKTTAIASILGLIRPDEGAIRIAGIDVHRAPRQALRQVGALVESPTFLPLSQWLGKPGSPGNPSRCLPKRYCACPRASRSFGTRSREGAKVLTRHASTLGHRGSNPSPSLPPDFR